MLTIRKATTSDIEKMTPLWIESLEFHRPLHSVFETVSGLEKKIPGDIRAFMEKESFTIFLAEEDGVVKGYSLTRISLRPDVFTKRKKGWIGSTHVGENFRGQGIGTALIGEIKKWFRENEVDFIELEVNVKNEAGVRFWKRMGFETVSLYLVGDPGK